MGFLRGRRILYFASFRGKFASQTCTRHRVAVGDFCAPDASAKIYLFTKNKIETTDTMTDKVN